MDKYDKEIFFEYLWKAINFFYWTLIGISFFIALIALMYVFDGMTNPKISRIGLIKVSSFIIAYVVIRNLLKPYFMRKMN